MKDLGEIGGSDLARRRRSLWCLRGAGGCEGLEMLLHPGGSTEVEGPKNRDRPNGVLTAIGSEGFHGLHATLHGSRPMQGAAVQGPARDHGKIPADPGPAGGQPCQRATACTTGAHFVGGGFTVAVGSVGAPRLRRGRFGCGASSVDLRCSNNGGVGK